MFFSLFFLSLFCGAEAMPPADQELVAVSICKRAVDLGFVSPQAKNHVKHMRNSELVTIDLKHLLLKAAIRSARCEQITEESEEINLYKQFLKENRVNTETDEITSKVILALSQEICFEPWENIFHLFTGTQAWMELDKNYSRTNLCIKFVADILVEGLSELGLENDLYQIRKAKFAKLWRNKKLHQERNRIVKNYLRSESFSLDFGDSYLNFDKLNQEAPLSITESSANQSTENWEYDYLNSTTDDIHTSELFDYGGDQSEDSE